MRQTSGTVNSAELCAPLENVLILRKNAVGEVFEKFVTARDGRWIFKDLQDDEAIHFQKNGYVDKQYCEKGLPGKVRLLEDRLIGYQEKLWFLPGEKVNLFVHSPKRFSAKLFRHGLRKQLILDLGHFHAQRQRIPDDHFVDDGLEWRVTTLYEVPSHARPGIYSLLLQSEGEEDFAIPLVVSTPPCQYGVQSKILVLASTNTWQSYNIWGGRSRYKNFEDNLSEDSVSLSPRYVDYIKTTIARILPVEVIVIIMKLLRKQIRYPYWKFKKLSIKRPFTNCLLEGFDPFSPFTNHLAAGEWRLLAWLEREGYDYNIVSGFELHTNPGMLDNYKCIILNTHCEYWTREMFEGLKSFHEEKRGWILNISGNSIYREIEFLDDGSTRCVGLSFKDSCADEAKILGVRFSMSDYASCAPYKILEPDHWVFSGIPVSKSKTFGGMSLNQNTKKLYSRYDPGRLSAEDGLEGLGASGWETDKICKSALKEMKVVAKGLNKKGGADMVLRHPKGNRGGMFSASSVVFGGCLLVDNVASMIVRNVLNKALSD